MFSHIAGNDVIKAYLTKAITNGTAGNSLLFAGPKGIGKELFAVAFAKGILSNNANAELHKKKLDSGNHPDLHIYKPEGKIGMHSIHAMRELSEEVYLPPYESERKVFIIYDAERMLPTSANALLKTFEEPSLDTLIILLSNAPELIIPTIMSRLRKVYFSPVDSLGSQIDEESPIVIKMLNILSNRKFESYAELVATSKEFAEQIEGKGKELEEELRAMHAQTHNEKMTATQRESLDKELDGAIAMESNREANKLFDTILGWHRDLQLLSINGNHRLLVHKHSIEALKSSLALGSLMPLEKLFSVIDAAKLALSRSTSLNLCLENLFLKLEMLK